jgi:hypothetical protein
MRCENLRQAMEYIRNSKLSQYQTDMGCLQYLFDLLIENSDILENQFKDSEIKIAELEEQGTDEVK